MEPQEIAKLAGGLLFFAACVWVLFFRPDPKFDEYVRLCREAKEQGHDE